MRVMLLVTWVFAAMISLIPLVSADTDRNDSLSDPEQIGIGTYWGNVTEIYSGTELNLTWTIDNDCYGFTISGSTSANVSLKKLGGIEVDYLRATFHYADGSEIKTKNDPYVRIKGESDWCVLDNPAQTPLDIVILIQGNGSYSLKVSTFPFVKKIPADYRIDYTLEWKDAEGIADGSYSGSVSDSKYYYRVTVPKDHYLRIEMEKTDGGDGMIFLDTFAPSIDNVGWTDVQIRCGGDLKDSAGSWRNTNDDQMDKIIRVSGNGSYEIKVSTTEKYKDVTDPDETLAYVYMGLIFLMVAAVPILLFWVLVALIVIAHRLKSKRKQGNRSSRD